MWSENNFSNTQSVQNSLYVWLCANMQAPTNIQYTILYTNHLHIHSVIKLRTLFINIVKSVFRLRCCRIISVCMYARTWKRNWDFLWYIWKCVWQFKTINYRNNNGQACKSIFFKLIEVFKWIIFIGMMGKYVHI